MLKKLVCTIGGGDGALYHYHLGGYVYMPLNLHSRDTPSQDLFIKTRFMLAQLLDDVP